MLSPVPAGRSPALSSQGSYPGRRGGGLSRRFFPLNGELLVIAEGWRGNRLQLFGAEYKTREEDLVLL